MFMGYLVKCILISPRALNSWLREAAQFADSVHTHIRPTCRTCQRCDHQLITIFECIFWLELSRKMKRIIHCDQHEAEAVRFSMECLVASLQKGGERSVDIPELRIAVVDSNET